MNRVAAGGLCVALWCASATAAGEANAGAWRVLGQQRGITVSVRNEPGRELPTFRGQGVIEGNVLLVLAIVLDVEAATQWAEGADEVALVREIDARTQVIYTRTDTPWPVSDRDIIMKRRTEVLRAGEAFRLHLEC